MVILLHGLGADGNDLIGLAPYLAQTLPEAEFLSPDAPFPCDMAPLGRQWFSLSDLGLKNRVDGARAAQPYIERFIDAALAERELTDRDLALVGFSQGTMMSLFVALRRLKPCAAVVGFSGALLGGEALADELRARPPILLIHGDRDPVVPAHATHMAAHQLRERNVPVEILLRPGLGHSIDEAGILRGRDFLAEHFAPSP